MLKSLLLASAIALLPLTAIAQTESGCVPVSEELQKQITSAYHPEYAFYIDKTHIINILRTDARDEHGISQILVVKLHVTEEKKIEDICILQDGMVTRGLEKLTQMSREQFSSDTPNGEHLDIPALPGSPTEPKAPAAPLTDMPPAAE